MSCSCGHGPWHYREYSDPAPEAYPPAPLCYPATEGYGRRRRRRVHAEELADYLRGLGEEIARIREELDELRGSNTES